MDRSHSDADERRRQFTGLLQSHLGMLRKLAWGFSDCAADRADLLQDMAVQLWAAFPRWDAARPFPTWAYRVALNVALSAKRRTPRSTTPPTATSDAELDPPCPGEGPEQRAQGLELRAVIDGLDPLNRALLLLHLEELDHQAIGEVLGLTANNVGVRLHRLKQRLRNELETRT